MYITYMYMYVRIKPITAIIMSHTPPRLTEGHGFVLL